MSASANPAQLFWMLDDLVKFKREGRHNLSALEMLDLIFRHWHSYDDFYVADIYPHTTIGDLAFEAFASKDFVYPDEATEEWEKRVAQPFRHRYD